MSWGMGLATDRGLRARLLASPARALRGEAAALRDAGHGDVVTWSPKVFIPLTRLCRDVCGYCTFAAPPGRTARAYLSPDEVLEIARAGAAAGCKEALFTLGDKPELRYRAAREGLAALGFETTIDYLVHACRLVFEETGLLAHANPGALAAEEVAALRRVSVSQGLMLESLSPRLARRGMAHHGSPDKRPGPRLATLRFAGEQAVPFTTGLLVGIGETREERLDAIFAIAGLHARYGHVQEVIVQNFRPKPGTRMAAWPEAEAEELAWTIAAARIALGPDMSIQAPPNLSADGWPELIDAGIDDWGGVSPVTPDHVNPEAPWPRIAALRDGTARKGKQLVERLAVRPAYAREPGRWIDPALAPAVLRMSDADGLARGEAWAPGAAAAPPRAESGPWVATAPRLGRILDRAAGGNGLAVGEIAALFAARGGAFAAVREAADELRRAVSGDRVTYVVNRNVNYTNICGYACRFCAFSKGRSSAGLRGKPYDLGLEEIARRAAEAWRRGATEICLQGGIHPDYTGETYLGIVRAVKAAAPDIHVHAFSPLEISQGAATSGRTVAGFLAELTEAGLGSLPGTAAEILDPPVREILCPDKVTVEEWLAVVGAAHRLGLRTTATIMFGSVEGPESWARHLAHVRALQAETGGFTEFVPLPFVHMEAPIYLRGRARRGPTWREAVLMHAVARLALHPLIPNVQASWVKMGREGAAACLEAGVNDLGGTLMNESISRAAGTAHGQELPPSGMEALARAAGRPAEQRTTLYGKADEARVAASLAAPPLAPAEAGAA